MFHVSSLEFGRRETRNFKLETALFVVVQSSYHPEGELVGFVFRIGPKYVMAHFMVDHVNPASFRIVLSALLPIFRVDQIDLPVFISLAGGSAPVNILEPFHLWILQMIEPAKRGNGLFKILWLIFLKKGGKQAVDYTSILQRRQNHPHGTCPAPR